MNININRFVRGKTIVEGFVFFGGGNPRFLAVPRFCPWGPYVSIFWLGAELVIRTKRDKARGRS